MLLTVREQLDDEPLFLFTEDWLDSADDAGSATDLESIADLQRGLALEVSGRHDRLSATKLVSVLRHELSNHRPAATDREALRRGLMSEPTAVDRPGHIWLCSRAMKRVRTLR